MADAERLADEIASRLREVPGQGTPMLRSIGREYSRELRGAEAGFVVAVAERLARPGGCRFVAYEILVRHRAAFQSLTPARIVRLGEGISSWSAVDCFGFILAGPAWREGLLAKGHPEAVRGFLDEYEAVLAPRVKREVRNKIISGLARPRRHERLLRLG